ncbi:methyltransferase [Microthyrium microscopicum]|uniref:tRNA N(3)-methylcytidine methyltransferase n=1 Tax=Microthyrium microscopicum TaxID=703497 RepID=A0A6A6U2S8_9PEZI|nr:methyltransferase [Microthyrium microscopicum]
MPGYIHPVRKPRTDSSQNPEKRSDPFQFGSRYLEEGDDIFSYNAWDHVETDETYRVFAEDMYAKQRSEPVSEFDKKRFNETPERWWNKFYSNNNANFFKDRKWLHQEFPILSDLSKADAAPSVILEVGAGAGNTAFPVMKLNQNPGLTLHACDFSKKAVEVIQKSPDYNAENMLGTLHASVWDIAAPPHPETEKATLPEGIEPGTVDVVVLIFIFSALAPSQWAQAVKNVWACLKPGGQVLFRDYGRGDLAQVRFKKGRYMEENFYVRGDGTRVYFFDEEELRRLWTGTRNEGAEASEGREGDALDAAMDRLSVKERTEERFEVVNFGVDRRMLVNRQRRLKMYRCWMQARFKKPDLASVDANSAAEA